MCDNQKTCQILRSLSRWSGGLEPSHTEKSIHNAYIVRITFSDYVKKQLGADR
jgi:hypothetical protein